MTANGGTTSSVGTQRWAIVVHGGAGAINSDDVEDLQAARIGLAAALQAGCSILARNGSSLDAVEAAIVSLENDPLFNAGRGAVYTASKRHELEASLATSDLQCGSVTLLERTKNPIRLAREVMLNSPHVFLSGKAADAFAEWQGLDMAPPEYFATASRLEQLERYLQLDKEACDNEQVNGKNSSTLLHLQKRRQDELVQHTQTVGAVAIDATGALTAGTSTGGRTAKWDGRIGDTPIHGAGNYACSSVAVSGTGLGEEFIKHGVCRDVAARMQYLGMDLQQACEAVVEGVLQPGDGGVIAVDNKYNTCLLFNTKGMYHGVADSTGRFEVGIFKEDSSH